MQRRKGSSYEVSISPSVKAAYSTPDSFSRLRHTDKADFVDLRVDGGDRATAKGLFAGGNNCTKAPLHTGKSKPVVAGPASYQPPQSSLMMMPSATPNGLKRCQSASMIRKKLQSAMEQSTQSYQDQIAALRSLHATAMTTTQKPTPQTMLNHQKSHGASPGYAPTPTSTATSDTAVHPRATGNNNQQHRVAADNMPTAAAAAKPNFATLFADPATLPHSSSGGANHPSNKKSSSGGFKSTCIQLEVEFAERLNVIERSKLTEKAESRFRASQRAFRHVIQQDQPFGRILASIRDEYEAYIAFVTQPNAGDCHSTAALRQSNQSRELGSDAALIRKENATLKRNCASMQTEIQVLQASLLTAALHSKSNGVPPLSLSPEEDPIDDDGDLGDVLLLSAEDAKKPMAKRPPSVPQLDFTCLSPYDEEEEEYEDGEDNF